MSDIHRTIHRYAPAIVLIPLLAFAALFVLALRTQMGEDVSAHEAPGFLHIPEDATNVNYYYPGLGPMFVYDFAISEEGFQDWVRNYSPSRLTRENNPPFEIPRYDHELEAIDYMEIQDGMLYSWTHEDEGTYLAYDRHSGRAFYCSHSR